MEEGRKKVQNFEVTINAALNLKKFNAALNLKKYCIDVNNR
jgi:hypothetical protein